jgi:Spy/CpxP family protein refolding chaperone
MKSVRHALLLTTLAAALAGSVFAQTTAPAPAADAASAKAREHKRMDPAQRQERFQQRMADLKQKLQITPQQENAWTTFAGAMQPPQGQRPRIDREALASMTTPERIDQMRAMRDQRNMQMDRRAEATKAFYAALTPEQQKTFDEIGAQRMSRGHGHGGKGHGHHGPRG